jgi:subtilisin family serine protease
MMAHRFQGRPIPVLAVVKRDDAISHWMSAAPRGQRPPPDFSCSAIPNRISIDLDFAPLPVDSHPREAITFGNRAGSEHALVRGYVSCGCVADLHHAPDGIDAHVFADPRLIDYRAALNSDPIKSTLEVKKKLRTEELAALGLDGEGVAIAIMDSGINLRELNSILPTKARVDEDNSWAPETLALAPGEQPMGHGTMCAYGALIAAPRATLLDFPILIARGSTHDLNLTVGAALEAYARLADIWKANRAAGAEAKYRALVVNNSWGVFNAELDPFPPGHPCRYIDNPKHPFHESVIQLAQKGIDILFAAGNCGDDCPDATCLGLTSGTIMGANASAAVLTIAGCDADDERVGYSSQGPSIRGMPWQKPDIAAYTHFKGSEIAGYLAPDGGTSTACAVASGCIAALRTKTPPSAVSPDRLFETIRMTAHRSKHSGWNPDFGFGVINPVAAAQKLPR